MQMVGVNFLMLLKRQGIRGCILADEMGLGKTAQAICFLGAPPLQPPVCSVYPVCHLMQLSIFWLIQDKA